MHENELAFVIEDACPVIPDHAMIIPKRHVSDYFSLFTLERAAMDRLLFEYLETLLGDDPEIS